MERLGMSLQPTGLRKHPPAPAQEPTYPHPCDEDYEPLNVCAEGDWPDLSDRDEAPLWGMGERLTTDPYEWKRERNG
jgi:hypothetical protein